MELLKCCLGCITLFGCRDKVVRNIAFHPPRPTSYTVKDGRFLFVSDAGKESDPKHLPWLPTTCYTLTNSRGNSVPAVYFQHEQASFVLLYCHGNGTDLGYIWDQMAELATELTCSVYTFEYTGYGPVPGKPSEKALYSDIRAAYQHLTSDLKVPWKQIIVYGQSLGSALACDLASQLPCAALILHSPLASALQLFSAREVKPCSYDVFANAEKIRYIRCPVFIMHGTEDREIPVKHGECLASRAAVQWPAWWVPAGGHNDIDVRFRDEYISRIQAFVTAVKKLHASYSSDLERYESLKPCHSPAPPYLPDSASEELLPFTRSASLH